MTQNNKGTAKVKLKAKKNEYNYRNNISRIYSENLWKLPMK